MIRFDKVAKHYNKNGEVVRALDGVSIEVPEATLALVRGPSGSGKTTLIHIAAGLTRPTSGGVTVAGETLHNLSVRERAALRSNRIALVFQMFHLVPYLTALENVLLPTLAASTEAPLERAHELLDKLGLAKRRNHRPSELSAGERQRCALARAVLNRPKVILADEPTGNLDEESAAHVLQMLDECRNDGATVLIASHQHLERINASVEFELRNGALET
jgi:ABC-type lipoprotein export system ATPase subunit